MINFIGYAASFFVVLSFIIKDNLLYIRLTNLVGCILFVIYGYCIMSIPVILPNAFLIIVQIVYIWKSTRKAHKQTQLGADSETIKSIFFNYLLKKLLLF